MSYITWLAALLAIPNNIPAGFLAVIMGFAALDEIRRYKYKGKFLTISSMIIGILLTTAHLVLNNIYK